MKNKKISAGVIITLFSLVISGFLLTDYCQAKNQIEVDDSSVNSVVSADLIFLTIIVLFIVILSFSIWIYNDAKKRGEKGGLWLVIVLLSNFLGIFLWFIIRPPIAPKNINNSYNYKPRNNRYHTSNIQNMYNSGIETKGRLCPECGRPIPFDAKVCPYCGKKFIDYL